MVAACGVGGAEGVVEGEGWECGGVGEERGGTGSREEMGGGYGEGEDV